MTKIEYQKLWETRISNYRASGQKAKEWCAAHNVTLRQLWYWLRKDKTPKDVSSPKPTQWLAIKVCDQNLLNQGGILVRVGQACIEVNAGFDRALFSEIVRVLAEI